MSPQKDYVNEKLPIGQLFPLGLQHVLSMYAGALTVPIILAGALKLSGEQLAFLISADLFTCGLATLLQSFGIGNFLGIKLPTVLGCSFVAISPMIAIGNDVIAAGGTNIDGLRTIFGAGIITGLLLFLIANLFGKLTRFFPPVVTGTVITVVGLSLMPVAMANSAGGTGKPGFASLSNILLALLTLLIIILMNRFFKGFLQSISVLVGIIIGTVVAAAMGKVNTAELAHAGWFAFVPPFKYGMPIFTNVSSIISLGLVAIVTSIEAVGVFLGLGDICEKPISEKDIIKGIRAEGIAKALGGVFNSFPYATFSQNVGLVTLSGIKSRWVTVTAGIILVVLGLLPKFAALGTIIPMAVLGGATLSMFGMVAVSGLRILMKADFAKPGTAMIVAVAIAVGLGAKTAPTALAQLTGIWKLLFGDGIIAAAIFAIALNLLFNWKETISGKTSAVEKASAEGSMGMH